MAMSRFWRLLIIMASVLLLAGCARSELLQGLDERQANEVVAMLLRNNIDASKQATGKTGFRVRVDASDLSEAIDLVQYHGLPSQPRIQVASQFPADAMVSTPLAERARLLSAIEQRLEESLSTLEGVHTARVHVSYDGISAESPAANRKPSPMHVAAVLVHERGQDAALLLQSSKRFLRNAFIDVAYDDISVVLSEVAPMHALSVSPVQPSGMPWRPFAVLVLALLLGTLFWHLRCGGIPGLDKHPGVQRLRNRWRRERNGADVG